MPNPQFAPAVYPVPNRYIDLGKEPAGSPGTVAAATYTFPLTQFKPVDKYTMLPDEAWRNAMAQLYNYIQGVRIADLSMGGPFFADGCGYPILNILGDYYQSINGGVTTNNTSLSVPSGIGTSTVVVASATGITTNTVISIGGTLTTACEVRRVTNVTGTSPGTLTLNAALYQAHTASSANGTVFAWSSYQNIGHTFALLNNGLGAGGWTASQPATYTFYDFSGVPASTGTRQYVYTCFSEVTLTSEATALIMWDGKATALASTIAASQPTVQTTAVAPQAAWRSTVNFGGVGTLNVNQWKLTMQRHLDPKFTNSNQQDPFAIARGYFTAEVAVDVDPASDEQEFLYYLNNTQPSCSLVATNGLAGTLAASVTVTANQVGFDSGELNDSKTVFGFTMNSKLVANTTNVGPSAGYGPVTVTLANQVINY